MWTCRYKRRFELQNSGRFFVPQTWFSHTLLGWQTGHVAFRFALNFKKCSSGSGLTTWEASKHNGRLPFSPSLVATATGETLTVRIQGWLMPPATRDGFSRPTCLLTTWTFKVQRISSNFSLISLSNSFYCSFVTTFVRSNVRSPLF